MNEAVNTFLVTGDKFMSEMHLRQPGLTYSACGPFTKNKERIQGCYGMEFDSRSEFLFTDGSMGKNVIIFGADMSSSVHIDNEKRNILILDEGPTQGLDDTILTEEAIYPTNFIQLNKRFVLSLNSNESNSFLFVNVTKIYQFKAKDSQIKDSILCLGNTSKNFTINNIKKTR